MKSSSENSKFGTKGKWILISLIAGLLYVVFSIRIAANGSNLVFLIPLALLLLVLLFVSIDKFLILTVFLVPLSVQLRFLVPEPPFDIFLPTELMLLAMLMIVIYRILVTRDFSVNILKHPVSVLIYCLLAWTLITSATSTMPLVSVKSLAAKIWFIASFYFLASEIFKDPGQIRRYFLAYITGMAPVVIFFLIRMWQAGIFNQAAAYGSPRPFFLDHTALGAGLAFIIPVIIYYISRRDSSLTLRVFLASLLILFVAAFILSYSRAAWLSLAFAVAVTVILVLRISWKLVLTVSVLFIVLVITSWSEIIIRLNENRQESSADMARHLQSIANIRSDASNMERLNRWKAALRMSAEKPLLGWGPGTYQFKYAPFQVSAEKTIISTNYGEGGNAHSEYLGAMAESGVPGAFLYLLILIVVLKRGILIWKHHRSKNIRFLSLALLAGIITYFIHGGLNNFLDSDKISALFWGMTAAIVAIDTGMKQSGPDGSEPEIGSDN